MNRARVVRAAAPLLAALLLVAAGCRRHRAAAPAAGGAAAGPTPVPARLVLFFPGDDGLLHRETREVPELPAGMPSRVRLVVEELAAGSRAGYASPFPWPVTVDAAFVDRDGNAYLDLSPPPADAVRGTATEEGLTWAAVNSVVANCPGVERVQLVFGGREVETLGHISLARPLPARPELVAP